MIIKEEFEMLFSNKYKEFGIMEGFTRNIFTPRHFHHEKTAK
jgi:hypothetical protein